MSIPDMLMGMGIGLLIGIIAGWHFARRRAERNIIEIEHMLEAELPSYFGQTELPLPPPMRVVRDIGGETPASRLNSVIWHIYRTVRWK